MSDLEAFAASFAANGENFPESCGWTTPFHLAIQFGQSKSIVEAFLNMTEVDLDALNAYNKTPLDIAEERQSAARISARLAGRTFFNATQAADRGRASGATTFSDQRVLDSAVLAARSSNTQAQNEKDVAEDI